MGVQGEGDETMRCDGFVMFARVEAGAEGNANDEQKDLMVKTGQPDADGMEEPLTAEER